MNTEGIEADPHFFEEGTLAVTCRRCGLGRNDPSHRPIMTAKAKAPAAKEQDTKTASGKPMPQTVEERLAKLEADFARHTHGRCGECEVPAVEEQAPAEEQKTEGGE